MASEAGNGSSDILDAELLRQQIFQELAKLGLSNSPFCKIRHGVQQAFQRHDSEDERHWRAMARWRLKDRIKTQAAALVLCLNIGVDPPDVIRVSPCARLECWIDPDPLQATKSTDSIAKTLQAQYERWQHRAKYKYHADPTVEDVKRLCSHARRTARNERALFHYNGHGVPRPTNNGEIWVFNRQFTQYIPVSVYDLAAWLGQPAIYVLDCSHAGIIVECLKNYVRHSQKSMPGGHDHMHAARSIHTQSVLEGRQSSQFASASDPMKEIIVLAACGSRELLPQDSDLCADIFTACLTTPIKVAMRWSLSRGLLRDEAITRSAVDRIPGRQTDRKTMLGELNWILTSITDTIAWNVLPRSLFQKLFRQDLLVASLFRNFMLSERIMKACGCQPVSHPRLPPMHQHPLWESWDMTAEAALRQLPAVLADETQFKPSAFFEDQLTAFELWLRHSGATPQASPPQQLPIVLQVLLSQVHRLRALKLLGRFLDMGAWSVQLALSVGIFPYVLKLLQTTLPNLRSSLVFIWCKILASDKACQQDLVKDNAHLYFCSVLQEEPTQEETVEQALACRTQAVFVLTMICSGFPPGQRRCQEAGLLDLLVDHMTMQKSIIARCLDVQSVESPEALRPHTELLTWCMLALGKLCDDQPIMVNTAVVQHSLHWRLKEIVDLSLDAEVRAAAVFALGCLIDTGLQRAAVSDEIPGAGNVAFLAECEILNMLTQRAFDGSMLVRSECAIAIARAACVPATASLKRHILHFQQAFEEQQKRVWMAYEEHCNAPSGNGSQRGSEASVRMFAGDAVAAAARERTVGGITGLARSRAYTRVAHSDGAVARGLGRLDPRMPNRWTLSGTNEQPGQDVGGYDVDRYSLPTGRASVVEPSTWLHASPTIHGTAIDEEPSIPLENTSAPGNLLATSVSADNKGPPAASSTSTSSSSDSNYTTAHQLTEALSAGAAAKVSVGSTRAEEAATPPRSPTSPAGTSGRGTAPPDLADAAPCDPSAASDSQLLLYLRLVEVLGILATDPAPLVAHHGRVTLQTSGHQVSQLPPAANEQHNASQVLGGSLRSGSLAASMLGLSVHGGTQHHTTGGARLSTGALGHGRSGLSSSATSVASSACHEGSERGKWAQLGNLFRMPRIPGHQQRRTSQVQDRPTRERTPNLGQTAPISPASNVSPTTHVAAAAAAAAPVTPPLTRENCLITPMPHMLPPVMLEPNHNGAHGLPETLQQAPSVRPFSSGEIPPDSSPTKIPESLVFKLLSQQFRQPQSGGTAVSSTPANPSGHGSTSAAEYLAGTTHQQHAQQQQPQQQQPQQRRAACLGKIESSASVRAKELAHFSKRRRICEASEKPKLTEHVQTLETFCLQGSTAVVHHSADDVVTCVDVHGVVHAMDASGHYGNPSSHHINCYDVCSGAVLEPSERASAPTPSNCTIVSLFVLNELQSPTLMACAADGAVRVWDKHLERGEQQLVAAWQSVDIESTSFHWHGPTSYTMQPHHNILVASGGHAPENIFVWDLEREHSETVLEQFSSPSDVPHHFFTPFLTGNRDGAALIFAGGSDGIVRVFDLRQEDPIAKIRPHEGTLTGIAYRQQGHVLASASVSTINELHFSDTRKFSASLEASSEAVFRRELAHNTGRIAALCAHPYAPLFASGSDRQVVKIWQQNGDMLSSIRAKPLAPSYQSLQLRLGKTTGMSFAPFDLKLALGAGDSLCSIYKMEQKNVNANLSQTGLAPLPSIVAAAEGHSRENGEGTL